ncbi:MAG: hypothetical protein KIT09_26545 [Bryobacteraceae bacterium]|nr:hypothetical protein [Bryobacteraceae bacterium]
MSKREPALLAVLFLTTVVSASAQGSLITCVVTGEAPLLRTENHAERVGDIRITCSGGDPAEIRFVNYTLFLDTAITSDITGPDPDETEALLLIDDPQPGVLNLSNGVTYEGQVKGTPGATPGPAGGPGAEGSGNVYVGLRVPGVTNRIVWNGVPFAPAPPGSTRVMRIVNVRGDMTRLVAQPGTPLSVTASISASPSTSLPIINPQVVVGRALPSLSAAPSNEPGGFTLRYEEIYTTAFKKRIENTSNGPTTVSRQNVPETAYFTESGFTPDYEGTEPVDPGVADTGTRFVARFTNLPVGSYLVAPNGTLSVIPGVGAGQLEARRVLDFGPNFAGGVLVGSSGRKELVPIDSGQATLVYEVVAQAPYQGVNGAVTIDRFDIPVQVVFPQPVSISSAAVTMGYAPADPTPTFSRDAPEPRFSTYETPTPSHPVRVGPTLGYVTFSYVAGDPLPLVREFRFDAGAEVMSDTLTLLPQTGGNWLNATPESAPRTNTIRLAANPSGLAPGRYFSGFAVRLQSAPDDLVVVPVLLDILPSPELLVETTPVTFRAFAGGSAPAPHIVYLTARNRAVSFTLTASATGGDWLSVTASSTNTPANISIAVDPSRLAGGTYQGTVTIFARDASNSPQTIPVTLIVVDTVPIFEAAAIVNAASYMDSGVAPGQIVTIFGNAIGPETAAGPEIDANGRFSTMVAGTRILFGGTPAPIIAVSRNQSSVVVPFSVATLQSVEVRVEFEGAQSAPVSVPVRQAAPGIFTANAQGTGQGSILNQDLSVNSVENPADRGSAIAIYITGGGVTEPASADGVVTDAANPGRIMLPVTVRIGDVEAVVEYAGGAPGAVAGLYQINARIGADVTPGPAVPVEVTIGGARSQPGVTVAVR